MATTKKATAPKKTTTKVAKTVKAKTFKAKTFKVNFQCPAKLPEILTVKAGTTIKEFVEDMNIAGYEVSVNGIPVQDFETPLSKEDIIRIGVKTKNN
jgi:hypothetical protein